MNFVFPLPPCANHYKGLRIIPVRGKGGKIRHMPHFYLRPEAKAYRLLVQQATHKAGLMDPLVGEVDVGITIYRARKAGDTDGFLKVLLDAMQESVYENDRQIRDLLHVRRRDDKDRPRVEVQIVRVADPLFPESD